ncbi:TonB-dependent receptor plug domain-containing protein [uncultured Eudoraea sp.]|uniref:TonB-dependent receptor plug domain-containing protein n=1 Tax=uncultured Eudoraea sp. TaxID=1035614 RepID=UPI002608AFE9|nr:TonB-dependent receptor plug domain-containing protein [uncultured Eudoraea sp.]
MRFNLWVFIILLAVQALNSQESKINGSIVDSQSLLPIADARLEIEGTLYRTKSDTEGRFELKTDLKGDFILSIEAKDFNIKRLPLEISMTELKLGQILLEKDFSNEQNDALIALTETQIIDEQLETGNLALLTATRDVFLNRAAFDFGQVFFRVRGYDSRNNSVLINGIPMNKLLNGRPQWNNWGGLNDIQRNQVFNLGLGAAPYGFGGLLGSTYIDTRPSGLRPGFRFSGSFSNRTYSGRIMATYTSRKKKSDFVYSLSASRRWAREGYIDGTLYDAFSVYGAIEYQINSKNSLLLTAILASNRRGSSSALTSEVYRLTGNRYNPYWGVQDGNYRNSRERKISEPIILFNYYGRFQKLDVTMGLSYQFGSFNKSRIGYFNAPNPDPVYYRYLPSFYINSPIGANFVSAQQAKQAFLLKPQLQWENLYRANSINAAMGKASYILYNDTREEQQLTLNTSLNIKPSDLIAIDMNFTFRNTNSQNFALIEDLLGADYHDDRDPFSDTLNDVNGDLRKGEGDIFSYNYAIDYSVFDAFVQMRVLKNKWNSFIAANFNHSTYQRTGLFLNERFPENSFGKGKALRFLNYGIKGGVTYKINGRQWISTNGAFLNRAPLAENSFINPRENNTIVPDLNSEKITSLELNYFARFPNLIGRLTGFYTRFQKLTDINFFFVDAGVGSDFVQEAITNLDKLHMGMELGLSYQLSSSVSLSAALALGKYVFASDPNLTINFDTAGSEEDFISIEGRKDLGRAEIKNYKLPAGPQTALSLGIDYRDPKYWWVSAKVNYLSDNYTSISTIRRTQSFLLNPETGQPFENATSENVAGILKQNSLDDIYLLNIVGGKSWLLNGKYLSVFVSINNVFDADFRTGGYEQNRNGNYGQLVRDNLSDSPSFGPKFWFGYGRTYFLNLAISF